MNTKMDWIRNCIMQISLQERKKRKYKLLETEVQKLRRLPKQELEFEYISLKSEYEYKKNILTLFFLTIILAALADVWNFFYKFIQKTIEYTAQAGNASKTAEVGFFIAVIAAIFVSVVLIVSLISYMKGLYSLHRSLLLVQMVKDENTEDGS